jgi:hypothetical protein
MNPTVGVPTIEGSDIEFVRHVQKSNSTDRVASIAEVPGQNNSHSKSDNEGNRPEDNRRNK